MEEKEPLKESQIKSVEDLLENYELNIPEYQRPYEWEEKDVYQLLIDIKDAKSEAHYRVGNIILHYNKLDENQNKYVYDIVDGQQRILTLLLLKKVLGQYNINTHLTDKIPNSSDNNIENIINKFFTIENKENYAKIFEFLEFVVFTVGENELSEAFQLFDSQNSRGKDLRPHDILKAYHLRIMNEKNQEDSMINSVTDWELNDSDDIENLFNKYLFRIYNWSHLEKAKTFNKDDINLYKGVDSNWDYEYVKILLQRKEHFQLYDSFISGEPFFQMVKHYIDALKSIKEKTNDIINKYEQARKFFEGNSKIKYQQGFKYTQELFYCAVLCYYDRFGNLDERIIRKLFVWAFMLRIDMRVLPLSTINNYANATNYGYSNQIPVFYKIVNSNTEEEILKALANLVTNSSRNASLDDDKEELLKVIKEMNGEV